MQLIAQPEAIELAFMTVPALPEGHDIQDDARANVWYFPATHATHPQSPTPETNPAPQVRQSAKSNPGAADALPTGHCVQVVLPLVAYVPQEQPVHCPSVHRCL